MATTEPREEVPTEAWVASGVILRAFGQLAAVPPFASENSRFLFHPRREPRSSLPPLLRLKMRASCVRNVDFVAASPKPVIPLYKFRPICEPMPAIPGTGHTHACTHSCINVCVNRHSIHGDPFKHFHSTCQRTCGIGTQERLLLQSIRRMQELGIWGVLCQRKNLIELSVALQKTIRVELQHETC
jgi:hypothetical protein